MTLASSTSASSRAPTRPSTISPPNINNPSNPYVIQNILTQPGLAIPQSNLIARNFPRRLHAAVERRPAVRAGPNWMIDLAYIGSKGTHLPDVRDLNQTNPLTAFPLTPSSPRSCMCSRALPALTTPCSSAPRSALARTLAFLVSYTFSKSIDDVVVRVRRQRRFRSAPRFEQSGGRASALRLRRPAPSGHQLRLRIFRSPNSGPANRMAQSSLRPLAACGILSAQSGSPFTVNLSAGQSASAVAAFGNPARRSGRQSVQGRSRRRKSRLRGARNSRRASKLVQPLRLRRACS